MSKPMPPVTTSTQPSTKGRSGSATSWTAVRPKLQRIVPIVVTAAALLALWHLATAVFGVSALLLPPPLEVADALVSGIADGTLISAFWVTAQEVLLGLVVGASCGSALGIGITRWSFVEKGIYPLIIAFHSIPTIAVAPLIIVYLGYGMSTNIVVTSMVTFFPLVVNTVAGIRSVSEDETNVLAALSASERQIFRKVRLPAAMPYIFTGLDIAAVLAVIGAVVAEFLGSTGGLGYLEQQYNFNLNVAGVYTTLLLLGVLGVSMHAIVVAIRRVVIFWE